MMPLSVTDFSSLTHSNRNNRQVPPLYGRGDWEVRFTVRATLSAA